MLACRFMKTRNEFPLIFILNEYLEAYFKTRKE